MRYKNIKLKSVVGSSRPASCKTVLVINFPNSL